MDGVAFVEDDVDVPPCLGVYGVFPLVFGPFNQPSNLAQNPYWGFQYLFLIYRLAAFGHGTIGAALYACIGGCVKRSGRTGSAFIRAR